MGTVSQGRRIPDAVRPGANTFRTGPVPQLESRDFFREIHHPVLGKVRVPAELFKLSESPYQLHRPAPILGQDNREVYVDGLEYDEKQFTQLRQLNVI